MKSWITDLREIQLNEKMRFTVDDQLLSNYLTFIDSLSMFRSVQVWVFFMAVEYQSLNIPKLSDIKKKVSILFTINNIRM